MHASHNPGLPGICRRGALALAALLATATAQAGYVDTATGLEWRQLTETVATNWTMTAAKCDVATGVCGGDWAGWTWATMADVRTLLQNLGIPVSAATPDVTEYGVSWAAHAVDRDGSGTAHTGAFYATSLTALYADFNGLVRAPLENGLARFASVVDYFGSGYADAGTGPLVATSPHSVSTGIGVFLYRTADTPSNEIPEPSTAALLSLGAAGLLALRRRRPA